MKKFYDIIQFMNKKILIIGNSASVYALAKKISGNNEVFVAPGSDTIKEFATCVDIREDSTSELLEFVLENSIDFTIPVSLKALNTNIVELFNNNEQSIFAPSMNTSNIIFDKTIMKKVLYKLRIPTPKFGIFEKQNMAFDYIKNLKSPFVIKTNEPASATILTSQKTAKTILDSYFAKKNQKVLVEDYAWGTPFALYVVTDGYKALPIGSSILYKHSLEGDGGQLTSGMGACVPNYKISLDNEYFIMDNVVYPLLEYFEQSGNTYLGVLSVQGILSENGSIQILGFEPFMQDADCSAILELLEINFINLVEACILGSFSDEFEYIAQKDLSATSLVLVSKNKDADAGSIKGLEALDDDIQIAYYPTVKKNRYLEFEAQKGSVMVLTAFGRTITSSTQKVYEEASNIEFKGLFYRKDICKPIKEFV